MANRGRQPGTAQTLCWDCKRALLIRGVGCCWAWDYEPVPGWTAVPTERKEGANSYLVIKCPRFLPDDEEE